METAALSDSAISPTRGLKASRRDWDTETTLDIEGELNAVTGRPTHLPILQPDHQRAALCRSRWICRAWTLSTPWAPCRPRPLQARLELRRDGALRRCEGPAARHKAKRGASADLARIARHQRQATLNGDRRNLEIVRTDPLTLSFERTSDLGAFCGWHHRTGATRRGREPRRASRVREADRNLTRHRASIRRRPRSRGRCR